MALLIWAGLFFPAIFAIGALCAALQRQRARRADGWSYLTPGPYYYVGLASGVCLSVLFTLISAAGEGGGPLFVLIPAFFIFLTMIVAVQPIVEEVRWNNDWIERRTFTGQRRAMPWIGLCYIGYEFTGYCWISAYQQPRLRYSPYDNGHRELMDKITHHLRRNKPPVGPAELTRVPHAECAVRA